MNLQKCIYSYITAEDDDEEIVTLAFFLFALQLYAQKPQAHNFFFLYIFFLRMHYLNSMLFLPHFHAWKRIELFNNYGKFTLYINIINVKK